MKVNRYGVQESTIHVSVHYSLQSNHTVMVEWIPKYVHREDILNHLQLSHILYIHVGSVYLLWLRSRDAVY